METSYCRRAQSALVAKKMKRAALFAESAVGAPAIVCPVLALRVSAVMAGMVAMVTSWPSIGAAGRVTLRAASVALPAICNSEQLFGTTSAAPLAGV